MRNEHFIAESVKGLKRVWPVLAIAVGAALALVVVHVVRPYGVPAKTLKILYQTLAAGDVAALRAEEPLAFKARADAEVLARGEELFQKHIAVYLKQKSLGQDELNKRLYRRVEINNKASQAGAEIFRNLSEDERWQVWVQKRKIDWLYEKAKPRLRKGQQEVLPETASFLEDEKVKDELLVKIGKTRMNESDAKLIDQVLADTNLLSDSYYSDALDKCKKIGQGVLRNALDDLYQYMAMIERRSRPRPDEDGAEEREYKRSSELGYDSLSADEKQFLSDNKQAFEASDQEPWHWTLGWPLLAEEDRALLGPKPYAEFVAEHDVFVEREGVRLYTNFLQGTFGACSYSIDDTSFHGLVQRSLLRSDKALVTVYWTTKECADYLGEEEAFDVGGQKLWKIGMVETFNSGIWTF